MEAPKDTAHALKEDYCTRRGKFISILLNNRSDKVVVQRNLLGEICHSAEASCEWDSSEATGRSAPAIPRERIYSWPSQRRGRKKSRSGLPLYQVGHKEKEPVPLENAGAAPPGMAARAAARQAASSSSRKSKRKERIGFYLSNKVRRTGEPAGSPRAPRTAKRSDVCK